jgi:signal transduction histidine kinase
MKLKSLSSLGIIIVSTLTFFGSSSIMYVVYKNELISEAKNLLEFINQNLKRNIKDLGIASKTSPFGELILKKAETERSINDFVFDKQEVKEMYLVDKKGHVLSRNTKTSTGLFLENHSSLKEINPKELLLIEDEILGQYWTQKENINDFILLGKDVTPSKDSRKILIKISVLDLFKEALIKKNLEPLINYTTHPKQGCQLSETLLSKTRICLTFNSKSVVAWKLKNFATLFVVIVLLGIILFLLIIQLKWKLILPNQFFLRLINGISKGQDASLVLQSLPPSLRDHQGSLENLLHAVKDASTISMSKQIAHDIRAPLAALKLITQDLTQIPEDKKFVLNLALQRIQDISKNLLNNSIHKTHQKQSLINLALILENLIIEKNYQYKEKTNIDLKLIHKKEPLPALVRGEDIEFGRVFSNLIDNAVEAIGLKSGFIKVELSSKNQECTLSIRDNGPGIPQQFLTILGSRGATFGKESGFGLGIHHAKSTIESWNGKFEIVSSQSNGTEIRITLPEVRTIKKDTYSSHASC